MRNIPFMKTASRLCAAVGTLALLSLAPQAFAQTTLTFDNPVVADDVTYSPTYGSFAVGTPNVEVAYLSFAGSAFSNTLTSYANGYGDLVNVAYAAAIPFTDGSTGEIVLAPQAGFSVTLESFDLAGFGGGLNIPILRLVDNTGATYAGFDYAANNGGQATISNPRTSFAPGLTSTTPIRLQFGDSFNVAIDNVRFRQTAIVVVPEAGAATLLPLGALLLGGILARRRRA